MKKTLLTASLLLALQGCQDKKDPNAGTKTDTSNMTPVMPDDEDTSAAKPPVTTPPSASPATPAKPKDTRTPVKVTLKEVGLDADAINKSADPCQDFYEYACGNWLKNTEIPADQSVWYRSFSVIEEQNQNAIKEILEKAQASKDDPNQQKIGTYYGSCMDEASVEKAGTKSMAALNKSIKGVKDKKTLAKAVSELHKYGIWVLFDITAVQDAKDATQMIAGIDQNGLGMPDRDYYFEKTDKEQEAARQKIVDAYKAYVETILKLSGYPPADAKSNPVEDILKIETALAKASLTRVEKRDPEKTYNRVERKGVIELAPDLSWDEYFKSLDQPGLTTISVSSKEYLKAVNQAMTDFTPKQWQAYLTFHAYSSYGETLSKAFVDADFAYIQKLTGQEQQEPRWKRCVNATDGALGELVGQVYVKTKFPEDAKKASTEMILTIRDSFIENLPSLTWMDDATRAKAKEKRDKMEFLIGYPDKWKAYDYKLDPKNYSANALASTAYEIKRTLAKVGKPIDRKEWYMTPPTVNAYYDSALNEMVFPAGILQPPFYSVNAGVAVNMGAMGMVVGHELTHGFDDEGSQFDANGNLSDWWSPKVKADFESKTKCVIDQYSGYEALPGLKLNGELTTGENIADIGGIKFAFKGYQTLRKGDTKTYIADGFTEDQQFFLGFAQAWCAKPREEYLRLRVATDPHSPAKWRVNGAVSANPIFADVFDCKPGAKMRPSNACVVW